MSEDQSGMSVEAPVQRTTAYRLYLVLLLAVYVGVYGWLLASTGFMPYVMDNNESFSVLWHASNLYHFDFSKSLGLTDEAFSPEPDAHPVFHTHQGNMPRLFGVLIYWLGARTIESQIAVTTAVVGTLAVLLIYHYFAMIAGPLPGFICSVLLITDYLLFMQWHVVTYRVWYGFLFFLGLLCVHGIAGPRRRTWTWVMSGTWAMLFYFELVFAGMVTLTATLYALYVHRGRPGLPRLAMRGMCTGAAVGSLILILQLSATLGPAVAVQDFGITFLSRNDSADGPAVDQLRQFFESNNIAYWYNLIDGRQLRNLEALIRSQTYINLQVYTPLLTLIAVILFFAWGLSQWRAELWPGASSRIRTALPVQGLELSWPLGVLALTPWGLALWLRAGLGEISLAAGLGFLAGGVLLGWSARRGPLTWLRLLDLQMQDVFRGNGAVRLAALACLLFLLPLLPYVLLRQAHALESAVLLNAGFKVFYLASAAGFVALAIRPGLSQRSRPIAAALLRAAELFDGEAYSRRIATAALLSGPLMLLALWIASGPRSRIWPWLLLYLILAESSGFLFVQWTWLRRIAGGIVAWVAEAVVAKRTTAGGQVGEIAEATHKRDAVVRLSAVITAGLLLPFAFVVFDERSIAGQMFGSHPVRYFLFLCLYGALCALAVWCAVEPRQMLSSIRKLSGSRGYNAPLPPGEEAVPDTGSPEAREEPAGSGTEFAARARGYLKAGMLTMALFYALTAAFSGSNVFGTEPAPASSFRTPLPQIVLTALASLMMTLLAARAGSSSWLDFSRLAVGTGPTVVFLVLAGTFTEQHWRLYEQVFSTIWMTFVAWPAAVPIAKAAVALAIVLGALVVYFGTERTVGESGIQWVRYLLVFFLLGQIAYSVIFFLSPGYVLTGYQWRHAPFSVFFTCVIPALAVGFPLQAAMRSWGEHRRARQEAGAGELAKGLSKYVSAAVGGAATLLAAFVCCYWISVQLGYARLLPPDHFRQLKELRQPPFLGKSFIVSNYAAPAAAMTGNWAYFDPLITTGWERKGNEYRLRRDRRYLWFRDRHENKAYERPDYFLCMMPQTLTTVVAKLSGNQHPALKFYGCPLQGIVSSAMTQPAWSDNELLKEGEVTDHWAVVKLNYDYPPYLEQLGPEELDGVNLSLVRETNAFSVVVDYVFLQANGSTEGGTMIELYVQPDAESCDAEGDWRLYYRGSPERAARLPSDFSGKLQAFVTPKTGHKTGRRHQSQILHIENGEVDSLGACSADTPPAPPTGLKVFRVARDAVELFWRGSPGARRYSIEMARGEAPMKPIGQQERGLSYKIDGVPPDSGHRFRVSACNESGKCSWATPAVGEEGIILRPPPEPIAYLKVHRLLPGQAYLEWPAAAYARYYLIEKRTGGGALEDVERPDYEASREWIDGLDPKSRYIFRVRACGDADCGQESRESAIGPYSLVPPPGGFRAQRTDPPVVRLSWREGTDIDRYRIEMASGEEEDEFREIGTIAESSFYTVGDLDPHKAYRFRIRACRHRLGDCSGYAQTRVGKLGE